MISDYLLVLFVFIILLIAFIKNINAYDAFIEGIKDGLKLFLELYPALVAMMFAIELLKQSGIMQLISSGLSQLFVFIPSAIWPMILFRPLSGNATLAILVDIIQSYGIDSFEATMASMIEGASDTTFYVITLYFSSVGVKKIKNALSSGLIADVIGISIAILMTFLFLK